jgi:excisionase family DNA binding protein
MDMADGDSMPRGTAAHAEVAIKLLLTVDEAAMALGIKRTLLCALLMRGDIPSIKVGRLRRVPVAALTDYVSRRLAELPRAS